jgi:6-phosphofructokinase 1
MEAALVSLPAATRTIAELIMAGVDRRPAEFRTPASEREFPEHWISEDRIDVNDGFVSYARPLIGEDWVSVPLVDGRQRFARLEPIFAEKQCAEYVPQAKR